MARAHDLRQLGEGVLCLVAGNLDGAGVFRDLMSSLKVRNIRIITECKIIDTSYETKKDALDIRNLKPKNLSEMIMNSQ